MEHFLELLALPAVQRSAIGLAVAAVGLPIVGVFIVGLDIIAVRFAIMHVALLGIAVGLLVGLDPMLCGLVACGLAGAGVAPLARRPAGLPGAMGLLMTFAIATALLVLSVSGVNATGAFELLWGSILATRDVDLVVLTVLAVAVHLLFWRYRRQLALLLFDRELALCSGVAAGGLMLALLIVVAVAIGASIRLTGALLVDALTILPALAARNLGRSLTSMAAWAVAFGVLGNAVGFTAALLLDQPPGPVLVLVAGTLTLLTYLIPEGALHALVTNRRRVDRDDHTRPVGDRVWQH
ncbi:MULTISPECIES: metal ABC transporter permease [unclassified Solwaraspora]|uniref:metal ABC transporter permease n=1 Tax=unclassified Solwaraspora TaxID=2627926 RepID=UPI00248C820B|nr:MULTISPECIES: metal ABC transporter permease [unclassified Solwaraspora]WBB98903.1 metal ABC transporter permease [Solwaraspora sp. WMMA2059]WBC22544.1 metal ABC transporter permease [Solwaraspora sp. WMMA2080]WJK35402.1 metal ABC transporter permease [Solwaraspora sp. WMMA2065]